MIDLQPFCATEEGRYDILKPFQVDGFIYATDAAVSVRVPAGTEKIPDPQGRIPSVQSLPWDHDKLTNWKPWKADAMIEASDSCPDCDGAGVKGNVKDCHYCEGYGCSRCQQTGKEGDTECDECDGEGERIWPSQAVLGGLKIKAKYFNKIAAIGDNVEYCIVGNSKKPIRFRWPGGQGLLMPLSE